MKKAIASAAFGLAIAGVASSAQAQDLSYYAGLGAGAVSVDYKAAGIDQKKASVGAFLRFGADVNEYFAAELRVGATGNDKKSYAAGVVGASATDLSFSSPVFVSYLGKFKYPVSSDVDLYMLAGATTARIKGKSASAAGTFTQTKLKTGLSLGAGVDYHMDSKVSVGAEWTQYMFPVKLTQGSVFAAGSKARMWGVVGTLGYHF